jgi:hypothetical protein
LQLAGGDSGQGDHVVGCELLLHFQHVLFQTIKWGNVRNILGGAARIHVMFCCRCIDYAGTYLEAGGARAGRHHQNKIVILTLSLPKGKYLLFAGRKHTPGHPFQTAPRSGGVQCPDLLFHHEGTESRRKTRTTRTNKRKVLPSSSVAPCLRVSVVENQTAPRPRTQRL